MVAVLRVLRGRGWCRFSLHTALLLVICVGSLGLLWLHWHPWRLVWESVCLSDGADAGNDLGIVHVYLVDGGHKALALGNFGTLWHGNTCGDLNAHVVEVPFGMYHHSCVATYAPWLVQASDSFDLPDDCADTKVVKEGLRREISFDYSKTPLSVVLAFFEETIGSRIVMEQPPRPDCSLISLRVTRMRINLALGWVCRLADMSWRIDGDTIVIGTDRAKQQPVILRWVNLADGEAGMPEIAYGMKLDGPMTIEPRAKWALFVGEAGQCSRLCPVPREETPAWLPGFEPARVFSVESMGSGAGFRLRKRGDDDVVRSTLYYRVRYEGSRDDQTLMVTTYWDSLKGCFQTGLHDVPLGRCPEKPAVFPLAAARYCAEEVFSPDDSRFFTSCGLYDSSLGGLVAGNRTTAAAFSSDSLRWVAASIEIKLLDARDGTVMADAADFALPVHERIRTIGWCLASWLRLPVSPPATSNYYTACCISEDGTRILAATDARELRLWENVRPTGWWGVLSLPEFWLSAMLTLLVVRSVIRDRQLVSSSVG